MKKKCFKCHKIKNIDQFYVHKGMADKHINKCKLCTKKDAKARYLNPISRQKIRIYEQKRAKDPGRKAKTLLYQRRRRSKFPGKNKARFAIHKALKCGRLFKKPCQICGNTRVEAHHKDYRKYLDVVWLCKKHHIEAERKTAICQ